ncbi:MAG: [NiFe] hydrogenase metallocenter assembly protein HypC [Myxococcales bacterium]|nr:[NiFe] hydrogenase metallocenter assembly protein HypC [Myxococcales bacterium]
MCLGIPGEVTEVHEDRGLKFAQVRFGGITREVCLECQPDAGVGDFVLVHVGFAIARIDRDEAARAWDVLEQIGQTDEVKPFKDDNPFRGAP